MQKNTFNDLPMKATTPPPHPIAFRTMLPGDSLYTVMEELIVQAFPPQERRDLEKIAQLAIENDRFKVAIIGEVTPGAFKPIGFMNYWLLDGFVYIEHLATLPGQRNKGWGTIIMQAFSSQMHEPIVLEVEPPTDELTQRRIGFYKRCGFDLWQDCAYVQPPYAPDLPAVELLLMVKGHLDKEASFHHVEKQLYGQVYGVREA